MQKQQQQRTIQEQRVSPAAALAMEQEEQPLSLSKAQILTMAGTLAASGLLDMTQHFNPEWVAAGILATAIAGKATPLFQTVISMFVPTDPDVVEDVASRIVDAVAPMEETDLPQDTISKLKRLFHIGQDIEEPAQPKDERSELVPSKRANAAANKALPVAIPAKFTLDEVLPAIKAVNKRGYVYFGRNADGEAISIHLADMYHVFDVSSSGKGKSNRFRLGMMQMVNTCETYFINPFANNVKPVKDGRRVEVWKPIFDRLANGRPMKTREEISMIMTALIDKIQERKDQEASGDISFQDEPIFVFVDELPEIFDLCPEAVKQLDKIGRTGRQFFVFTWVASQSASVEDIGQSTATQAQYKTRLYGGGDRNSSNRLMKGPVPADYESVLQTQKGGLTLMLAEGFDKSQFVQGPLITNEGLFEYLGEPSFDLAEWLPTKKTLPPLRIKNALNLSPDLSQTVSRRLSPDLSQDGERPIHAQETQIIPVKGQARESVKGPTRWPNHDAILEALSDLQADGKALTTNAIATRAKLTWRQYEEIDDVAANYGIELVRGKGRPKE